MLTTAHNYCDPRFVYLSPINNLSAEQTMDKRVMGHGSNGSTDVNGSRGSRVSAVKHLTHD